MECIQKYILRLSQYISEMSQEVPCTPKTFELTFRLAHWYQAERYHVYYNFPWNVPNFCADVGRISCDASEESVKVNLSYFHHRDVFFQCYYNC